MSSATRVNDYNNEDCIQQPSYGTSGVPVAPRDTTIKPATGRNQGNGKRSRGSSTSCGDRVQKPSSGTSGIPVARIDTTIIRATGENQGSRKRLRESTSCGNRVQQPSSGTSGVAAAPCYKTTNKRATTRNQGTREESRRSTGFGDRVKQPSAATSGVPVAPSNTTIKRATGRIQGATKSSRGSTSSGDRVQQPSSGTSGVRAAPCNTTIRRATAKNQGTREGSRGSTSFGDRVQQPSVTSSVPVPPGNTTIKQATGRIQGTKKGSNGSTSMSISQKKTSSSRTYEERVISGTRLLTNLGNHPSVYAKAGQNPPPKGLTFRGAWKNAVQLYRAANVQYKQLFADAGFGDFLKIDPVELPLGYLMALTERWFSETNTVHLPCGEIGPTPVDWTMVTGVHFGGRSISIDPKYEHEEALKLLGVEAKKTDFVGRRIRLSAIMPKVREVAAVPPTNEAKEMIFRRLFLYVIGGCFFGNNQSAIHLELVKYLEDINTVGSYDWGALTYAAFLSGMRKKISGDTGSFTAFWPFLLFWAFEYLPVFRPEHSEDVNIFPRALRWKFPKTGGTLDNSELTASRCQLDYVDESKVMWQPYLYSEKYHSADINTSITLAWSRIPFRSFDTWEYYLGERCRRQLGLPCRVPSDPPNKMHVVDSIKPSNNDEPSENDDPLENDEPSSDKEPPTIVNSVETMVEPENVEYAPWFASNSIGRIVDVTRLIGGTDLGRKVISDWMVKNGRGMILVPDSEVKAITLARDTADTERKKLQEQLARVRRGPVS